MIKIELNGETHQVPTSQSLAQFLEQLELPDSLFAVAINREIVPRSQWPNRLLQTADHIEIVQAVGGG